MSLFNVGFVIFPELTQLDFTGPQQVLAPSPECVGDAAAHFRHAQVALPGRLLRHDTDDGVAAIHRNHRDLARAAVQHGVPKRGRHLFER